MFENEVLNRLGLKDIEELKTFLDFSDRSEKIKSLYPDFRMPSVGTQKIEWNAKKNYYCLPGSDNVETNTSYFRRGWQAVLRPNSIKKYGQMKDLKDPVGFPAGNIPKGRSEWYFDRGHIFARQFHRYVIGNHVLYKKDKDMKGTRWTNDHIDCSKKNLFTQFSIANKAQSKVESEVSNLLEGKHPVYFEVKIVFRSSEDLIPIGTEIFYTQLPYPDKVHYYFIPNVDVGFDLSDTKFDYFDFYEKGYNEKLRNSFDDSDREINNYGIKKGKSYTVDRENDVWTIRYLSLSEFKKLKELIVKDYPKLPWKSINNNGEAWQVEIRNKVYLKFYEKKKLKMWTVYLDGRGNIGNFEDVKELLFNYLSEIN